jgi:hypothetical protein
MTHPDEAYIHAFLLHGGVSAVAEQLAVSKSSVYRRLRDDQFKAALEQARKDAFTVGMVAVHGKMGTMLKRLDYLTVHGTKDDAVKLNAIKTWLDLASRHREADVEQALLALEQQQKDTSHAA